MLSAEPVCSCACSLRTLHTRPRMQRAPGLPCALYFREGQDFEQTSGAIGAARSRMCVCRRMGGAKRYPSLHPPALMGIASLHPSYWIAVARDACAQRPQEGLLTKQTRTYSSRNAAFCSAAQLAGRPLLTGNGNRSGFSVLVRLAYKLRSGRFEKKMRGRKHA